MSQGQLPPAAKIPPTRVDMLLQIRSDMRTRQSPPYLYLGIPNTGRVRCFTVGYWHCTYHLGMDEGQDHLFDLWLDKMKKAWPPEGWEEAYLRECDGDHTRAVRKYLDYVAEFRNVSPGELAVMPMSNEERSCLGQPPSLQSTHPSVPILDELMEIRRVGRILMYIGEARMERMAGYIDGYRLCLSLAGLKDQEYSLFERWLQDTGSVPPGHTWEDAFLQAAGGDHEAAIHRLLDCAAEFRALSAAT
ncbi:uncharacterized protein STAUR_2968 [Stigmatella aurantiaca DW4/3-1]|uniref:Uncharacterized protein n=2 Tax=Stigmatella aurantiaca TaxID=41 RepID=Q092M9_STIAD|nr:uncharacterized protein STAUR_2968 [Stigmatella aurantiaca DW4/3-1]EAU66687.1 hypothetical protein STIAU_4286 [Stigmatella aurantiaca DW4/3-1]